jgi:hypothetical protein
MSAINPQSMGYTLIAPDPVIISPDLQLQAALTTTVDLQPPIVEPYGMGWAFDFIHNEFLFQGGAMSPVVVYDTDNLQMWIEKTLHTAQQAHPIYDDDYGMEDPFGLIGFFLDPVAVGDYEQQVNNALLIHDRIVAVNNFQYAMQDTQLWIQFEVVLDDNPQQTLTINTNLVTASS